MRLKICGNHYMRAEDLESGLRGIYAFSGVQRAGGTRGRRWQVREEAGDRLPWEGPHPDPVDRDGYGG